MLHFVLSPFKNLVLTLELLSDTAAYLGWHTALCCHHDWPEMSQPQSGTSETVKHNTDGKSHESFVTPNQIMRTKGVTM